MPFAKHDRAPELMRGKAHVALERIGSRFREPALGRFPFKRNRPAPPPDDPHFENGLADREGERAGTESHIGGKRFSRLRAPGGSGRRLQTPLVGPKLWRSQQRSG